MRSDARKRTSSPLIGEPSGIGAVVEDADGGRWVNAGDRDLHGGWWHLGNTDRRWSDFAATRVLSAGVGIDTDYGDLTPIVALAESADRQFGSAQVITRDALWAAIAVARGEQS